MNINMQLLQERAQFQYPHAHIFLSYVRSEVFTAVLKILDLWNQEWHILKPFLPKVSIESFNNIGQQQCLVLVVSGVRMWFDKAEGLQDR